MDQKNTVRTIAQIAILSALTFVVTFFNIPLFPSTGGLIHFSNVLLFLASILFGAKYGAWSGAIGMGLFDILGGYAIWAPTTIITRFLMGLAVGTIAKGSENSWRRLLAMVVGGVICILGYYIYEGLFISDFVVALTSALGDLISITAAILITFALLPIGKRIQAYFRVK